MPVVLPDHLAARLPVRIIGGFVMALCWSGPAVAAEVDGSTLSGLWALPFAGILMSMALIPMLAPAFWHAHFGKISAAWSLVFFLPFLILSGPAMAGGALLHALLLEYFPFMLLLLALYTVAGGIFIRARWRCSPARNTGLLAIGTLFASIMGTTGASMLMIRPLLRANHSRVYKVHLVVFFIFLVSNVGGALTPLGDPPLFLGFLKGVDFFWTTRQLFTETLFLACSLLVIFYLIDSAMFRKEGDLPVTPESGHAAHSRGGWDGNLNVCLLGVVLALVLLSGFWKSTVSLDLAGYQVALPALVRDIGLLGVILVSVWLTPAQVHRDNGFSWGPMREVAILFAGIFLTLIPVIAMLKAGPNGPFAPMLAALVGPDGQPNVPLYFWATGLVTSFLDNAPTYLVFFNAAGGDPHVLMTTLAPTLAAISAGAVFMGANSYIGNAPNLMVKAVAEEQGVVMPSFLGYMAWSGAILLPLFTVMTWVWFSPSS